MTANVPFYLIAILALRVKGHSLLERNVLIVDCHVKKYIYIHLDSLKDFKRNIRHTQMFNLIFLVSFKNQN